MEFRKRGSLAQPIEVQNVPCICSVAKEIYKYNQKYYIDLDLAPETIKRVTDLHSYSESHMTKPNKIVPLHGNKLKVKVPFRYNKVTCSMPGKKTVHDLLQGDRTKVNLEYCGVWTVGEYCGVSWKLTLIQEA
jgi:hypothetical protein